MHRRTSRPRLRALQAVIAAALPAIAAAQGSPVTPTPGGGAGAQAPAATQMNPIGVGNNPTGRSTSLTPGIRATATFSDNINLRPLGTELSGQLYEITPFLEGFVNSPRAAGAAYYGLRGQQRQGGLDPGSDVRHDLRAWGDVRIADDLFSVFARANVFDVNTSPFGATSIDPSTQSTNRTQYRDFELSPYLFGRFDGEGRWLTRYTVRYIDAGAQLPTSVAQTVSGNARTDLVRRQFGASIRADYYNIDYSGSLGYAGADVDLLGWYRATPTLRAGAGVAYSRNDLLTVDGKNDGWGPSISFEWTPDNRTFATGRWSDRYSGRAAELRGRTVQAAWTFGLDYFTGLTSGASSGLYGYNSSALFLGGANVVGPQQALSVNNPVSQALAAQNLLSPAGSSFGSGLSTSPLVYVDNLVASVGWVSTRNSILGTVFVNNRRTAATFVTGGPIEDLDQYGGSLSWTHRLDVRNAVTLGIRRTESDSNITDARATLDTLLLTWDYRITPRATATLGGRSSRQRGEGLSVAYDEAALFGVVNYRF